MNLAHLTREHNDGLRASGGRRRCAPPARRTSSTAAGRATSRRRTGVYSRARAGGPVPARRLGPDRALLRRPLRLARTDCRSTLGMPGQRDQHSGCVGAHLVEDDLFDFMLLSLPDNDTLLAPARPLRAGHLDRRPPTGRSSASCTRPAVPSEFLEDHAVIVMSDHSQTSVEDRVDLVEALGGWSVLAAEDPDARGGRDRRLARSQRSAMVYVLDPSSRRAARAARRARPPGRRGHRPRGAPRGRRGRRLERARRAALRARRRARGRARGPVERRGRARRAALEVEDGRVDSRLYPHALGRLWSALGLPRRGRRAGVRGARLRVRGLGRGRASRAAGATGRCIAATRSACCSCAGLDPPRPSGPGRWRLGDVTPMVLDHFSVPS